MTWNYRIVKYTDGTCYGLHEAFYDEHGMARSITCRAVGFVGGTPEEVKKSMEMAMRAFALPVLNEAGFDEVNE